MRLILWFLFRSYKSFTFLKGGADKVVMLIPVGKCSCSIKLLLIMIEFMANSNGKENGIIKLLLSGYEVILIWQMIVLKMVKTVFCWSEYQRKYQVNLSLNESPQISLDFLELRAAVPMSGCFVVS